MFAYYCSDFEGGHFVLLKVIRNNISQNFHVVKPDMEYIPKTYDNPAVLKSKLSDDGKENGKVAKTKKKKR